METKLFHWLDREFVEIRAEGRAGVAADTATDELFRKFDDELQLHGLSLDNCVRVRVWGPDKGARSLATAARSKILTATKKVASSSFISQQWFDSDAVAGLELLAMKPSTGSIDRRPVEFQPARNYLCYLRYDSLLFFSGFTSEAPTLEEQVPEIIQTLANGFAVSGSSWSKVARLSIFLQRSQKHERLMEILSQVPQLTIPEIEVSFVDGFAGEKYLLEIEATALSG
ncbi:MAG: hypothetical protein QOF64_625 [Candidatus Binatota bacterium]|nr:hypothetical protein [Candidatus Binatota bacterium]